MVEQEDYTALPLEALLAKEKKIKKNETIAAVCIGFLIGVMVFGVVKNGFGLLYLAIPIFLIAGIYRHAQAPKQNLKAIQWVLTIPKFPYLCRWIPTATSKAWPKNNL